MSALRLLLDAREPVRPAAVEALRAQLESLREVIEGLRLEVYRATPSRTSGSPGEHVRHCLDHVRSLIAGASEDVLSYDARVRGTRIEVDPAVAAAEIDRLCARLDDLGEASLQRLITLGTITDRSRPSSTVRSTMGREIAFVIQHTIHHCAIIAILLERLDVAVPPRFGYAPSTPSAA